MRISEDLQNEQKKKKKLLPLPLRIDRKSRRRRRRRRRSSFLVIRDQCVLFCGKNTKGFANLFVQQGLPPPPPLLLLLNKSNHDFLHEIWAFWCNTYQTLFFLKKNCKQEDGAPSWWCCCLTWEEIAEIWLVVVCDGWRQLKNIQVHTFTVNRDRKHFKVCLFGCF